MYSECVVNGKCQKYKLLAFSIKTQVLSSRWKEIHVEHTKNIADQSL